MKPQDTGIPLELHAGKMVKACASNTRPPQKKNLPKRFHTVLTICQANFQNRLQLCIPSCPVFKPKLHVRILKHGLGSQGISFFLHFHNVLIFKKKSFLFFTLTCLFTQTYWDWWPGISCQKYQGIDSDHNKLVILIPFVIS